ncbi:MAG: hypothetical protein WC314_22005 [Vulcanimicrobiota bacterium]
MKKRAAENNRSLQKELRHLLITFAQENAQDGQEDFVLVLAEDVNTDASWSRRELYGNEGR